MIANDGLYIDRIISLQDCYRHRSEIGEPCWIIDSQHGTLQAICNTRARKAGATGEITPYEKAFASRSKKEKTR